MARLRLGDICLNVEETGSGTPLVLLHGLTGRAAQWAPHVAMFARHFRTIAIDLLGHGQSDVPADPARYRMEPCVADLAALLDRLGISRAHWLGYSMGGRIALAFAILQPARVNRLVLEGASPGLADPAARSARVAHDDAWARRIEQEGIERFADAWMQQPLFASQARLGSAALAAARAARCANNPIGLANSLRGIGTGAQDSFWQRLPELTASTLLLAGAEDEKFRTLAAAMAARIPDATVTVISEAGHATHLENPVAFQQRVIDFLKEDQ